MVSSGFNTQLTDRWCEDLSGWLELTMHHTAPGLLPQVDTAITGANGLEAVLLADDPPIQLLLQFAQQQLQTPHLPASIRIALYLKICCLAIQKSFLAEQPIPAERLYHNLMQWLSECEPQWWQQCIITARGITSHDARIQDLLQPLTDFVQQEI